MNPASAKLLAEFETLTRSEQEEVLGELLGRLPQTDLRKRGITEAQAADLRARSKTFAKDWARPGAATDDHDSPR
jgi:hypothetical protein